MYVLAPNQSIEQYPYSVGELRRANPNTSFPSFPADELLAEWGVYPVVPTPEPVLDITKSRVEGDLVLVEGQWTQVWITLDASPEDIALRREQALEAAISCRAHAYTTEADPLFFKAQRGEATIEEWEAKVQEIRDRFPYPESDI